MVTINLVGKRAFWLEMAIYHLQSSLFWRKILRHDPKCKTNMRLQVQSYIAARKNHLEKVLEELNANAQ